MKNRCKWCGKDPLYIAYNDDEWGIPIHDDRLLFEFLILEGSQAGLSWLTILKKRENYRKAFHGFDYNRIANYTVTDVRRLLADSGIVRNRLKIGSATKNARGAMHQTTYRVIEGQRFSFNPHPSQEKATRLPMSNI